MPDTTVKTTTKDWHEIVRAADKDWDKDNLRPVAYEMPNGRKFLDKVNPYE